MNMDYFFVFTGLLEFIGAGVLKAGKSSHFIYPPGRPRIPHLPADSGSSTCACAPQAHCRGFAVKYYSFTLDA
jgi:hypothetical protein